MVLRYLIMCRHPAINPIPTTIPIKIPEINPIFLESKRNFITHEDFKQHNQNKQQNNNNNNSQKIKKKKNRERESYSEIQDWGQKMETRWIRYEPRNIIEIQTTAHVKNETPSPHFSNLVSYLSIPFSHSLSLSPPLQNHLLEFLSLWLNCFVFGHTLERQFQALINVSIHRESVASVIWSTGLEKKISKAFNFLLL